MNLFTRSQINGWNCLKMDFVIALPSYWTMQVTALRYTQIDWTIYVATKLNVGPWTFIEALNSRNNTKLKCRKNNSKFNDTNTHVWHINNANHDSLLSPGLKRFFVQCITLVYVLEGKGEGESKTGLISLENQVCMFDVLRD